MAYNFPFLHDRLMHIWRASFRASHQDFNDTDIA